MKKKKVKVYLCKEGKEEFTVKASSLKEAQEYAEIYNGVAIREIKKAKL